MTEIFKQTFKTTSVFQIRNLRNGPWYSYMLVNNMNSLLIDPHWHSDRVFTELNEEHKSKISLVLLSGCDKHLSFGGKTNFDLKNVTHGQKFSLGNLA
jgi:hypothetical protein